MEDNLDSVRMFATMVGRMGHKVEYAINGYVALDVARTFRPEVVFLDLMLPGIHGYDVARRLKKEFGDAVRIVVISAYGSDEDKTESLRSGAELHLVKPVDPYVIEELLA